ncbi:hypothetical protein QVD17_17939 [Tagetes erecta]|uniref:Uncharacterized protein n=1 Tax=Tagetes erecta TaxID=13708 RepID=A0AAD8KH22_TARER|nr:hypothetical protein QVD17_17939 [Tagetes erecta]
MGVVGRMVWMNTCSKKQCRSLFLRLKSAMKKVVKKHTLLVALYGGPKKHNCNFHYDPSSYALNFDDGTYHHYHNDHNHHYHHDFHVVEHYKITKLPLPKQQESHPSSTTTTWVYVIWVESF